MESVHMFIVD